jgi:predicted membrane metal-binding protein
MTKMYFICSIIFRILFGIIAVVIVLADFIFADLTDKNDNSLMLPFIICISCISTITIFHNLKLKSVARKIFQVLSILFVLATLIYSIYSSILILENDGSKLFLLLNVILSMVCLPLVYFLFHDRQYCHYS